jgi:hypothetical protein
MDHDFTVLSRNVVEAFVQPQFLGSPATAFCSWAQAHALLTRRAINAFRNAANSIASGRSPEWLALLHAAPHSVFVELPPILIAIS